MKRQGVVYVTESGKLPESILALLDAVGFTGLLSQLQQDIVIKPNLVEALAPPITTPVALVDELIGHIQTISPEASIIVAEGCGSLSYETEYVFHELGYHDMAKKRGVKLCDLNSAPLRKLANKRCGRWPEIYLPELLFNSFLISVPVLKAHSMAKVTLTMKNMIGAAPPKYYQQGGHWKKASFHANIQEAVFDLNQYRTPDFTLLDASVGMQEAHLWGPTCEPPHRKLVASFDPVAIDSYGTQLLGKDWHEVGHISLAHKKLGCADPLSIEVI